MTTRTRRPPTFRQRRQRRRTLWRDFSLTNGTLALAADSTLVANLFSGDVDNQGRTILRVVGDVTIHGTVGTAGLSEGQWGLVTQDAEAVNAGATFEPYADNPGWMHKQHFHDFRTSSGDPSSKFRWDIDIKARRRLTAQTQLYFVFQVGGTANIGDLSVSFMVRVLFALP